MEGKQSIRRYSQSVGGHWRAYKVALDKVFGEVAMVRGIAHSGIIRLVNLAARQQGKVCGHILAKYGEELLSGAMITAEPGRFRIRPEDGRFRS